MRLKGCILVLLVLLVMVGTVNAGFEYGDCRSESELNRAMNECKYNLAATAESRDGSYTTNVGGVKYTDRVPGVSYGCFVYCVDGNDRGLIHWAYSYNEATPGKARQIAEKGFIVKFQGRCFKEPSVTPMASR